MHHPPAIARNRTALLAVVAAIVALIGGRDGGPIARQLRNAALALLRPAEAATRRLIVILARGLVVRPRVTFALPSTFGERGAGVSRAGAFRLCDPRKRFSRRFKPLPMPSRGVPRVRSFWGSPTPPSAPLAAPVTRPGAEAVVDVARLRMRVAALEKALANLPAQARRLARWRLRHGDAKQDQPLRQPLRLGHPPGFRLVAERDIDHVLRECHAVAIQALRPNTS